MKTPVFTLLTILKVLCVKLLCSKILCISVMHNGIFTYLVYKKALLTGLVISTGGKEKSKIRILFKY